MTASDDGNPEAIETSLVGKRLLENPLLNKATAFTEKERIDLGLLGLLPPHIESLKQQVERAYEALQQKTTDIEKHIYLRGLQDTNETLFYALLHAHITQFMPLIYTPVVGTACQQFSEIYRRPRGLFISYSERDCIDAILDNSGVPNVRVIVVTDGERILGLGDQGAGGMGIPIGKLSLYTVCGGIDPATTLPIVLDVGTNNEERLRDPLYIGWRHERVSGQDYYDFVDSFVQAVKRKWPDVLLQFEDFAQTHASPLLERYRDELCPFNDDIQGTAAVTVGTLLAASKVAGMDVVDQTVVFLGAGSAGCGIAEQMIRTMIKQGLSETDARARFFMVDRFGLLHDGMDGLLAFQKSLVQPAGRVGGWASNPADGISLLDVVRCAKPTVLVGVSGQPGLFTEEVVRTMAGGAERPIIFPLSNPTSRIEATPSDLITWTEGRALIASGSPFEPVDYDGRSFPVAQCNNSYIFPGMGLGVLAAGARRVSDQMFMAAGEALAASSPAWRDSSAPLLAPLSRVRELSREIAFSVASQAQNEGLAEKTTTEELRARIEGTFWEPWYRPIVPAHTGA
jgi:malate dehydrogenase (oxaloacetate-decarboxylating)